MTSSFLFALCNPGSEGALKLEAATLGLRLSYQRRGFVTLKAERDLSVDDLQMEVACARRLCLSLGKFSSEQEAAECLASQQVDHVHRLQFADHRIRPAGGDATAKLDAGARVGTLVGLGDSEWWAGIHRHGWLISPHPGGDGGVEMPEEAPSRAWLKLEEASRFFGVEFDGRDVVVELGCAPGGVVHALLERGASVIGVDPAGMAEVVMRHAVTSRAEVPDDRPWFYHCRKPAALVGKRDLGQGVSWFMSDMNQSPEVVLNECRRFVGMAPGIRGVMITLKLRSLEQVADKEAWVKALRAMGFATVRLQQLAVHHRELVLLGLR